MKAPDKTGFVSSSAKGKPTGFSCLKRSAFGFTLAELLISLAILGVIATFTIPKVLNSQQSAERIAVFKETIAALNEAMYMGLLEGAIDDDTIGSYFQDHLNVVKICDSNAQTQGCWDPGSDPGGQATAPGIVLHNGAVVAGLDDWSNGSGADTIILDWNGLESPNEHGKDQIILRAFLDDTSTNNRIGTVRVNESYSESVDLWLEIFD